MRKTIILLLLPIQLFAQSFSKDLSAGTSAKAGEITRWDKQSKNVTIIRDNRGIPHIYGKQMQV